MERVVAPRASRTPTVPAPRSHASTIPPLRSGRARIRSRPFQPIRNESAPRYPSIVVDHACMDTMPTDHDDEPSGADVDATNVGGWSAGGGLHTVRINRTPTSTDVVGFERRSERGHRTRHGHGPSGFEQRAGAAERRCRGAGTPRCRHEQRNRVRVRCRLGEERSIEITEGSISPSARHCAKRRPSERLPRVPGSPVPRSAASGVGRRASASDTRCRGWHWSSDPKVARRSGGAAARSDSGDDT